MKDAVRRELLKRLALLAVAGYVAPKAFVVSEAEAGKKKKRKKRGKKRPPPSQLCVTDPGSGTGF